MRIRLLLFLTVFCTLIGFENVYARHIVGGDFSYRHLSGDTYELKMKMYRDCGGGGPGFDDPLTIGIYDKVTNTRKAIINLPLISTYRIKFNTSCISPELKCVETGIFKANFTMPANKYNNIEGYYIEWERCCRNNIISNIVNPGATAMGFYMEIPSPYPNGASQFLNNSPEFTRDPLNYLCVGEPFKYDFKAKDIDGDEMRFSLTTPLAGANASQNSPGGQTAAAPYDDVVWSAGYGPSTGVYIDGNPNLSVASNEATLYIVPTQIGVFVISVLCEEFRNGVKIGEIRRELQLEVIICPPRFKPQVSTSLANNIMLFTVGQEGCFDLNGIDGNFDENLKFRIDTSGAYELFAAGATLSPSDASGIAAVTTKFCWTPSCPLDTPKGSFIDFILYDNSCPFSQDDTVRVSFQYQSNVNSKPTLKTTLPTNVFNVKVDEQNCFQILGSDINVNDFISINTTSINADLFSLGATFPPMVAGQKNIAAEFCWTPTCSMLIDTATYLEFIIDDNACPSNGYDTLRIKINLLPLDNESPEILTSGLSGSIVKSDGTVEATIGEEVCIAVIGNDNDFEDAIDVYSENVNYDFLANGGSFRLIDQVSGSKQYEFCWTPTCDNLYAGENLAINFFIRDNKCQNEKFDTTRIKIVYKLPKNDLPAIIKPDSAVYHLTAGYTKTVDISGIDFDAGDFLVLSAEQLFVSSTPLRTEFNSVQGNDSVFSVLNLFPDCGLSSNDDYVVRFKLLSNKFCNEYDTVYRDVTFRVNPLDLNSKPFVPNVFSPNGDGINDEFKVYLGERNICPGDFSIQIFDRWGAILFETKDSKFLWKAEDISAGTYIYVIKVLDASYTGFIALVK